MHSDFKELLSTLNAHRVRYLVVGAYAVSIYAQPRATKDLDLLLDGSEENLQRAARALARYGAPPNVVEATRSLEQTEIVYLGRPPLRIDLLRAIDGVATADVLRNAVPASLQGTSSGT